MLILSILQGYSLRKIPRTNVKMEINILNLILTELTPKPQEWFSNTLSDLLVKLNRKPIGFLYRLDK